MAKKLSYDNNNFLLDGEKFTILSGTIHYFRVVEEYWEDRLKKLKNCGFNTVETYSPWNYHERKEGEFDFSGNLNVAKFIQTAQNLGLNVILRPGPYICAEWEMGGLPSWLLKYKEMHLRCNDKLFLECPFTCFLFGYISEHRNNSLSYFTFHSEGLLNFIAPEY